MFVPCARCQLETEYPSPFCSSCVRELRRAALENPNEVSAEEFAELLYHDGDLMTAWGDQVEYWRDSVHVRMIRTALGAPVVLVGDEEDAPPRLCYEGRKLRVGSIVVEAHYEGEVETIYQPLEGIGRQELIDAILDYVGNVREYTPLQDRDPCEVVTLDLDGTARVEIEDPLRCEDCGCVISWDREEDVTLCEYCQQDREREREEELVHDYSYKPDPIFWGSGTERFYGIELEVDRGSDRLALAEQLLCDIGDDKLYCKTDGSLGSEGLEIVTHPCSLEYHRDELDWSQICARAREYGYSSHDAGTCGLHIHVSRAGLGSSYEERELTIAKMILIVDMLEKQFTVFSRRNAASLRDWARIAKTGVYFSDTEEEVIDKIKMAMSYSRYVAVNTLPSCTVEFRLFRGTLRHETILASLELVDLLCGWVMSHTLNQVRSVSWQELISEVDPTSHLHEYLTMKGLL